MCVHIHFGMCKMLKHTYYIDYTLYVLSCDGVAVDCNPTCFQPWYAVEEGRRSSGALETRGAFLAWQKPPGLLATMHLLRHYENRMFEHELHLDLHCAIPCASIMHAH